MSRPNLAAIRAVARVRDIKEKDSRRALQQALTVARSRGTHVAELVDYLAHAPALSSPTEPGSTFTAHRTFLLGTVDALERARRLQHEADAAAESARTLWQHDKTQVNAVEMLIERRLEEARVERARQEAVQLDEIAAARWTRQQSTAAMAGQTGGPR